ncbi:hypothetical protein Nepgr_033009 [Nepenthes gracilis]|uniref:EF-hand domain-containing protein n=1 Tax=Nepenthes gracilis TaxID=150966 RepID=A0AAD3TL79_NEPGR|nr:hypothetical protein Nepgr_033009 [Nepenthes gracilis]
MPLYSNSSRAYILLAQLATTKTSNCTPEQRKMLLFLSNLLCSFFAKPKFWVPRLTEKNDVEKEDSGDQSTVSVAELKMVMGRLGILYDRAPAEVGNVGPNELEGLFEEDEPSFEEVKEAFDVFDQNRDGFIDAQELHSVLCSLGMRDFGSEVEECRKMISAFDKNGDGLLDYDEFLTSMEKCLC